MKLIVSIVFGIILILIFYCLISFWILADVSWGEGKLWMALLLVMPLALFLGSILTGYLSSGGIGYKRALIYYSPGPYVAVLCVAAGLLINTQVFVYMLILGLYLYLTSLAGTTIGYLIRSRIRGDGLSTRKDLQ
jgi:hypothetical protein